MSSSNNTLDLLEECLSKIYQCRKASLSAKAHRSFKRLQRRQEQTSKAARPKTPLSGDQQSYFDKDDDEDGFGAEDLLLESMSVYSRSGPKDNEAAFGRGFRDEVKSAGSATLMQGSGSFTSVASTKNDNKAAEAFDAFRKELTDWFDKNIVKRQEEDSRAEYADYLSEKYLAKALDPLPASRTVSNMRKKISDVIDEFVRPGSIASNFTETVFPGNPKIATQTLNDSEALGGGIKKLLSSKEYGSTLESRQQELVAKSAASLGHKSAGGSSTDDAKEKEKQKMKEQFEQYRKLKKQAEKDTEAVFETSAKAKEYEEHLDDIRSLLTSINDVKIKEK